MNAAVGVAAPSPSPSPSDGLSHTEDIIWGGVLLAILWVLFFASIYWLRRRSSSGGNS